MTVFLHLTGVNNLNVHVVRIGQMANIHLHLKLHLKVLKSLHETVFTRQQFVYNSICPCSIRKQTASLCLGYVFPALPLSSLHVRACHLSISVFMSGGRAGLGGEACQLDPVQRPGHQSLAGRDSGRADESHPRPWLRCQAHKQAGSAPKAPDHHPNSVRRSYLCSWDHWDHSHDLHHYKHHTQRGPAAWKGAAGCPEAEQHGGGWFASRLRSVCVSDLNLSFQLWLKCLCAVFLPSPLTSWGEGRDITLQYK